MSNGSSDIQSQALAYCQEGNWSQALSCFNQILLSNPNDANILCNVGQLHVLMGQTSDALAAYESAAHILPDWPTPLLRMGEIFMSDDRPSDALQAFERVVTLCPDDVDALVKLGIARSVLGHNSEAKSAFLHALDLQPGYVPALYNLGGLRTFGVDDPLWPQLDSIAQNIDKLSVDDQITAHFIYGKACLDKADTKTAFDHFHAGNRLKRSGVVYDVDADIAQMEEIIRLATPALLDGLKGGGSDSSLPIFIVGMPRSGSTLVEQILSSHPMVASAGEINAFGTLVGRINAADGNPAPYPSVLNLLSPPAMTMLGDLYLRLIQSRTHGHPRLVDKYLGNFLYAGLISASLPNAKIIHCKRDAVDTCISCYTLLFGSGQYFTFDMDELGRYWIAYDKLMAHWRSVLPTDRFIEVEYENLVADLEPQVRILLDRLGLEFVPECLAFHQTKRAIMTASSQQVRQPIYKSSVGRWKAAAPCIQPLLSALGRA